MQHYKRQHKQRTWKMTLGSFENKRTIQHQRKYQIGTTALQEIRWSEESIVTMEVYTISHGATMNQPKFRMTNNNL